jgi:hypothetical protein
MTRSIAISSILALATVLSAVAGADLPLAPAVDDAPGWHPIRPEVELADADGALEVRYRVATGQPAGAGLRVSPGTFSGDDTLVVRAHAPRNVQLLVTLQTDDGAVFSLPAMALRPGNARTYERPLADASYFAPQSTAPDPGSFDPARVVSVTLLDIAGFMGAATPEVAWTVESMEVRGTPERSATALDAEAAFFEAFNQGGRGENVLAPLMGAWAGDPNDPRTNLLLGLDHLWLAAEGDRTNPRVIEHLLLSERFLARAAELDPTDRRIPSWLAPTRMILAELEGDDERVARERADLLAAYAEDPAFHSFSVAMLGFQEERGSELFDEGLLALRALEDDDCSEDDPSCQNRPRWPHNQEGYLTFFADYELKKGEPERARALLDEVRALPTFAAWPYGEEVVDRLDNRDLYVALYADDDPGNDPPPIIATHGCSACHRTGATTANDGR